MPLLKTLVGAAFKQRDRVTKFLSGLFKSPPMNKFPGAEVQIDAVRGKEEYAIDVAPNSGSRGNKANIYTTKKYAPPSFDESIFATAAELNSVLPGRSQNDMTSYTMDLADLIVERQTLIREKIERAIEVQSRDAMILGKVILINGDEIDYKQKASHQFSIPVAWTSSTAFPTNDFSTVGGIIRKDSSRELRDAIFGETALQQFLDNDNFQKKGDLKMIERIALTSPMAMEEGATFHGQFSAGSYRINVWTYPQVVGIPTGFGLPNEGTKQPYIPTDKIICLPADPDFRLYFAGVATLISASPEVAGLTGFNEMPAMETADIVPYFNLDRRARALEIGVRSNPLAAPVGIDEFVIMTLI